MRVLVLVPARNEARNLPDVVRLLRAAQPAASILVVDDASTDATRELLPGLGVEWLALCDHAGVGGAIRAGLRYAMRGGYDAVIRVDGDGQHPADQVKRVLGPVLAGEADAAIGSRYLEGASYRTAGWRRVAQRALAGWISLVTRQPITDPTSGFWAFGRRAIRLLASHHPMGYPEPELLLLLSHNGLRVVEIAIQMQRRMTGRTSLTPVRLGAAAARTVLAMLILPLRKTVADAGLE